VDFLIASSRGVEGGLNLLTREARPQQRGSHRIRSATLISRNTEISVRSAVSSTERSAGVSGSGLDPDVGERSLTREAPVRDRVQCDSTCHAKVAEAGDLMCMPGHAKNDFLANLLNGAGKIHLPLSERALRRTRGSVEQLIEAAVCHPEPTSILKESLIERK